MSRRDIIAFALSAAGGLLLWTLAASTGHQREPWDAAAYWTTAYPLAILLSAALALFHPVKPWRWAVIVIFSQLAVMIAGGSDFSLLPLGLVLLALLSLPAIAAATLAAWLRITLLSREG